MKIYMKPLPKTCSTCQLGRRTNEHGPWYTCFITGRTHTSITTERPDDCPVEEEQTDNEPSKG